MKFLPSFRQATLVAVGVALSACHSVTDTPANRRELYNNTYNNSGAWHDYTRRRQAEALTGVSGGSAPSSLPGRPSTPNGTIPAGGAPGPLPPGTTEPALQAPLTPAVSAPSNVPPPADVVPGVPTDAGAGTPPATDTTTPPPQ